MTFDWTEDLEDDDTDKRSSSNSGEDRSDNGSQLSSRRERDDKSDSQSSKSLKDFERSKEKSQSRDRRQSEPPRYQSKQKSEISSKKESRQKKNREESHIYDEIVIKRSQLDEPMVQDIPNSSASEDGFRPKTREEIMQENFSTWRLRRLMSRGDYLSLDPEDPSFTASSQTSDEI